MSVVEFLTGWCSAVVVTVQDPVVDNVSLSLSLHTLHHAVQDGQNGFLHRTIDKSKLVSGKNVKGCTEVVWQESGDREQGTVYELNNKFKPALTWQSSSA